MQLNQNQKNAAFTLIELLVVISIISLLSSIAIASFHSATNGAVIAVLQEDAHQIETQVTYARQEQGLTVGQITGGGAYGTPGLFDGTVVKQNSFALGYLATAWQRMGITPPPVDPWGAPFLIQYKEWYAGVGDCSRHDEIYSAGPDGIFNGIDIAHATDAPGVVNHANGDDYIFNLSFLHCPN